MKKYFLFSVLSAFILALSSCSQEVDANKTFDTEKEAFVNRLWEMYPGWASSQGKHDGDAILTIPNEAQRTKEKEFAKTELKKLHGIDKTKLSESNQIDYQLMENYLKGSEWEIETFKSWEWNPSNYNVCGGVAELLANEQLPLEKRLNNISKRLDNVTAYYEAAKKNIKNPTAEHTKLAIDQNRGGASVFAADLPEQVEKSKLSSKEKEALLAKSKKAESSVLAYVSWLEQMPNPNPRSFRLGSKLYTQKFEFDIQSDKSPKEIYQTALEHKKVLHQKMIALSDKLWSKYMGTQLPPYDDYAMVKMLIDKISEQHTTPENFQQEIQNQIPELTAFVKKKNLLYLDPKKPLVVRKEPDYMAGVAGASISAPGPYDKNGKTYYNVGSMNGWSAEQSESYLREYNHYVLQILNIHEAIPGHYAQLVYSNQSPSIIKSIFGNGAMIEGWAVYTELMMLENGYGNDSPEMWLMYYKWNLRTTCNTILDYSVHNLSWSKEDAMNLLVREAYQQQAEADGKWKRATLSQVQLCSYFTGFSEIVSLRDVLMKRKGKKFQLKKFHEEFLSYGSAPVRDIRKLMLK
jgi:uncharacterized protein (DUF885 family)